MAGLLLLGKRKALRAVFPAFRLEYRETDTRILPVHPSPGAAGKCVLLLHHGLPAADCGLLSAGPGPGEGEALAGALREAVLNAVLHADYFSRGGLTIQRTAAELTVSNGGLLRVSPEQAQAGRRLIPGTGG